MQDNIIGALVGLAGACNNNPKTEKTDAVVIKALAFSVMNTQADADTLQEMTEEIYAEKYTIAPGCATCQSPCGNTSDFDMEKEGLLAFLEETQESIRKIRKDIQI